MTVVNFDVQEALIPNRNYRCSPQNVFYSWRSRLQSRWKCRSTLFEHYCGSFRKIWVKVLQQRKVKTLISVSSDIFDLISWILSFLIWLNRREKTAEMIFCVTRNLYVILFLFQQKILKRWLPYSFRSVWKIIVIFCAIPQLTMQI